MRAAAVAAAPLLVFASCAAAFQSGCAIRCLRRSRPSMAMGVSSSDLGMLTTLLAKMAEKGASRTEAEIACGMALKAAFSPSDSPFQSASPTDGDLGPPVIREGPLTASEAQQIFREKFTGPIVTTPTFNFVSAIVGDRAAASQFRYDRVYALGLSALFDAFLPATCITGEDMATRHALCIGLGLDAASVRADADALAELVASGGKEGLFAGPDFREIAEADNFKYTYVFGVGLITLMKASGEEVAGTTTRGKWYAPIKSGPGGAIAEWCAALGIDKYANRLAQDTGDPLSIDRVGVFAFPGLQKPPS